MPHIEGARGTLHVARVDPAEDGRTRERAGADIEDEATQTVVLELLERDMDVSGDTAFDPAEVSAQGRFYLFIGPVQAKVNLWAGMAAAYRANPNAIQIGVISLALALGQQV